MTFSSIVGRKNNDHQMGQLMSKITSSNVHRKLTAKLEIDLTFAFSYLCYFLEDMLVGRGNKSSISVSILV